MGPRRACSLEELDRAAHLLELLLDLLRLLLLHVGLDVGRRLLHELLGLLQAQARDGAHLVQGVPRVRGPGPRQG